MFLRLIATLVGSVDNLLLQVLEMKLQEVKTSRQELREENPDAFPDVGGGTLHCSIVACNAAMTLHAVFLSVCLCVFTLV